VPGSLGLVKSGSSEIILLMPVTRCFERSMDKLTPRVVAMLVVSVFLNACASNSIDPSVYRNTDSLIDERSNIATGRAVFHSAAREGDIEIKNTKSGNFTGKSATQKAELTSHSAKIRAVMSANQTTFEPTITPPTPPPSTSGPVVGIDGDKFTLNGVPTFLLGVSYFDVLGWKASDFDMLAARKFNLIRIWLDWGKISVDRSRSFFDANGTLVRKQELLDIVHAAAARGIVVDVTVLGAESSGSGNPENAVRNAVQALIGEPNVFFDLVNEHSLGGNFWSDDHARVAALVDIAHTENLQALITLSSAPAHYRNGIGVDLGIGLNFIAPHFDRTNGLAQTSANVARVKGQTKLPVYLQEENRRRWPGTSLTKDDFLQAARDAVSAGAAGWVFHTDAGFDLSASSFFDNLDDVELATIDELGDAVFPVIQPPTPKPAPTE